MRTRKRDQSPGALALLGAAAVLLAATGVARAQVSSDTAAGILVFPKISVDTAGIFTSGAQKSDTVVEITNTDPSGPHQLHCFWVDANSFCDGVRDPANLCDPNSSDPIINCRGRSSSATHTCVTLWTTTNFSVTVTQNQPIGFRAGEAPQPNLPCLSPNPNNCPDLNFGALSGVPEDPFVGELKCIETDNVTDEPVNRNDFIGTARIYNVTSGGIDVRQYNAVGIPAVGAQDGAPGTLCLGTDGNGTNPVCPASEYASCPGTLVLNHFFEGAAPFGDGDQVSTTLTLAPCTEPLEANGNVPPTVALVQLAIINEFEQRFSSSTRVDCFKSTRLSDIDTLPGVTGDASSIFAVGVQGTLSGVTRIRGVPANSPGYGLIGVAEESYSSGFSAAFNLNYDGVRPDGAGDVITIAQP